MKIKIIIIACCLSGLLSCALKKSNNNKNDNDENIIIKYVDPGSTSIYSISCERFDSVFTPEIKEISMKKNSHDFFIVDSLLNLFKEDTSLKQIDVRVKILVNTKDDSIICMDGIGQFFSEAKNKYMKNEPLKNFILKAIYSR